MSLTLLVALYICERNEDRPLGRSLSKKTEQHLLECARAFSIHLRHDATTDDMSADSINAFLAALLAQHRSPWGVKNRRTGLMVLWRFAHKKGLAGPPGGVRTVYCPPLQNDGYDLEQMNALLQFATRLHGTVRYTGLPRDLYWSSFVMVMWNLGLRAGDMLTREPAHFDPAGWLWVIESKTGKGGWLRLQESTTNALQKFIAVRPQREKIWPGYLPKSVYVAFRRLVRMAGLSGTSRDARRGAGSEYERLHPGCGWRFLRHSGPQVFESHYRVGRIVDKNSPGPPELG